MRSTTIGGHAHRIVRAVKRLREDFSKPLRIEDVAREIGMSVSGFHAHFKAVTAMSPLQFQKRLRLQEARRLMSTESLDAYIRNSRNGSRRRRSLVLEIGLGPQNHYLAPDLGMSFVTNSRMDSRSSRILHRFIHSCLRTRNAVLTGEWRHDAESHFSTGPRMPSRQAAPQ
jgi:AraC-like DNA-binding protein